MQPGQQVGSYQLVRELGRGAMGVVFAARHLTLGREVALKVMLGGDAPNPDAVQRFQLESQALARLDHPNVVKVHDAGWQGQNRFMVMELVPGVRSLKERLVQEGPFDIVEAVELVAQAAQAMQHAHDRGVLHRDLKPDNILIDGSGRCLVTDFGLARDMSAKDRLTRTGQVMGTPAYMPPEQADGDIHNVDARADVYSLGATLHALLTGQPPFRGGTALETLTAVLSKAASPPSTLRPEVDARLDAIVLRCLEKGAEHRYPGAGALADDLASYLRAPASEVGARIPWAAVGLVVGGGLVGVGVFAALGGRSPEPPAKTSPPAAKTAPVEKTVVVVEAPTRATQPTWKRVVPAGQNLRGCAELKLAYDTKRGVTWLFGGRHGRASLVEGLWAWNGARWRRAPESAGPAPAPRVGHGLAYDPLHDTLVLVSGHRRPAETWTWDGERWKHKPTPGGLQRRFHGLVHDGKRLLLFGGWPTRGRGGYNDVWAWSGSPDDDWRWLRVGGGRVPPPRGDPAMAWDPRRGRLLIYGGRIRDKGSQGPSRLLDDMWEWNGSTWRQLRPQGPTPGPKALAHMMHTPRGMLLVGGCSWKGNSIVFSADTWLWDGDGWTKLAGTRPLAKRWAPSAGLLHFGSAWDSQRNVAVVYGGQTKNGDPGADVLRLNDLWEMALPAR